MVSQNTREGGSRPFEKEPNRNRFNLRMASFIGNSAGRKAICWSPIVRLFPTPVRGYFVTVFRPALTSNREGPLHCTTLNINTALLQSGLAPAIYREGEETNAALILWFLHSFYVYLCSSFFVVFSGRFLPNWCVGSIVCGTLGHPPYKKADKSAGYF